MTARHVFRLQSLLPRPTTVVSFQRPDLSRSFNMASSTSTSEHISDTCSGPSTSQGAAREVPHVPIPRRGVDYRGKIVLAPMVRSGELPSRLLALKYGADLVWGPETVDRSMIGTIKKTNPRTGCIEWSRLAHDKETVLYRIDPAREGGKMIYQIGTSSPERAVEAAKLFAQHVNGIDVNAGCPKPFSTTGGMGAALLRTPDHLANILKALVQEVGIPNEIGISVKIRLLATPELTSELVHKLCKTGITGLTIHCRTTPMRPRERAIRDQLRMIGEICRNHGVACLMNGDVASREHGLALAEEYGVDGGMIATAAEANSSVFRRAEDGGLLSWREVVEEYFQIALSVENKWGNTKFLLSQLMPGKHSLYQQVQMSKSYSECADILELSDPDIISKSQEVDHVLGLDIPKVTQHDIKKENKRLNRERQEANLAKKRSLEQQRGQHHQQRSASQERSKKQKAEIASENSGFEGPGRGALAVAV